MSINRNDLKYMQQRNMQFESPVAVGGVDGSGTRVVASLLQALNIYIGITNPNSDNMWFSLLLKRPRWLRNADEEDIREGIRIFEKEMTTRYRWRPSELLFLIKAAIERSLYQYNQQFSRLENLKFIFKIFAMVHSRYNPQKYRGWGWKEPNSHVFLEHLVQYFPTLKYVQVIRHGLDMAYSPMQNQVYIWGHYFDVDVPADPEKLPVASLEFWIKSNKKAIERGQKRLGDRFHLLYFDRLCTEPKKEIDRFIDFLAIDRSSIDLEPLYNIPRMPSSMGRYKKHDTDIFPKKMVEEVKQLGFEVDL